MTRTGNFAGVDLIRDLESFDPAPYELNGKEIFVIGGAEIYGALLDRCDSIYATIVKEEYAGDTYFPEFEFAIRNFAKRFVKLRNTTFSVTNAALKFCISSWLPTPPLRRHVSRLGRNRGSNRD